ncbi:MAG: VWA domain-containing protein, partial [Myxococcota bacterium]
MTDHDEQRTRWRLILGEASEPAFGCGLEGDAARADAALQWLYGRDGDGIQSGPRNAGNEASQLTVPDWINEVHELFPKETIERLERDAVEEYGISEVVTDPRVLDRVEPNEALLQAVLRTKHLMNEQVLASARKLVAKVVERLMQELAQEVRSRFNGVVMRDRSRRNPKGGPLDLRRTLLGNLANYDPNTGKIYPEKTWFFERKHRKLDHWQIILLVDQSGSMLDSTIHASITAAILHGLPGVRSHLVVFDTDVVDLTDDASDPVKTVM